METRLPVLLDDDLEIKNLIKLTNDVMVKLKQSVNADFKQ